MISADHAARPYAMRLPTDLREANAADRERIANQQRLLAPSDDPAGWVKLASLAQAQTDNQTWAANVAIAARSASAVDERLSAMQTALDRSLEIAVSAGSPAFSNAARSAAIQELRAIAENLTRLVEGTDSSGQPLFTADPLMLPVGERRTVSTGFQSGRLTDAGGSMPWVAVSAFADALAAPGDMQLLSSAREAVSRTVDRVTAARSLAGADSAGIERIGEQLAEAEFRIEEQRSGLSDPDIPALIARIEGRQLTIEAANALFARINRVTLFDLLR